MNILWRFTLSKFVTSATVNKFWVQFLDNKFLKNLKNFKMKNKKENIMRHFFGPGPLEPPRAVKKVVGEIYIFNENSV